MCAGSWPLPGPVEPIRFRMKERGVFEESSLDQYLKEISAYPLLTREQEFQVMQAEDARTTA